MPPKKLVGGGISTPYTPFCSMCTVNSELTYFSMYTTVKRAGVQNSRSNNCSFLSCFPLLRTCSFHGHGPVFSNSKRSSCCVKTAVVAMGWLWMVGSLTLQVSVAKEPYNRDDILQKRPMICSDNSFKKTLCLMNFQSWFVRQKKALGANIRETQSLLERIIADAACLFTLQEKPFIFLKERNLFVRGACFRKGEGQFLLRVFHFHFFSKSCSCCVSVPSQEHDPFFSIEKRAVFAAWRDTQQNVPFFLENVSLFSKKTNMSIQSESADDRHSRMIKMFLVNTESTLLAKSPHTLSRKVPYFGTYSWRSADDSHSIWRDMELTWKLENSTQRFYTIFPLGAIIIVIFPFMQRDRKVYYKTTTNGGKRWLW